MTTKNHRVAAYLPEELKEAFIKFKQDRQLGDSPALIAILSEFLGVSQEVTHLGNPVVLALQQRIEALEEGFVQIKGELLRELREELLEPRSKSVEQTKTEIKDELLSEFRGELSKLKTSHDGQLELLVKPSKQIEEPVDELKSDPLAGSLVKGQKIVSVEIPKPPSVDKILTSGELAKRLRVDSSTLSHWRPTGNRAKSPEELLEVTRKKDPDGIGWIYLPEIKRFQPERDIPDELLDISRGELLTEPSADGIEEF